MVIRRPSRSLALLCAAALPLGAALSGCSADGGLSLGAMGSGPGSFSIVSASRSTRLDAAFTTAVYSYTDENTADLYLTDLDSTQIQAILAGQDRSEVAPEGAQLLHIHLFLTPRAGRTPIDFTASNTTLTHIVLAGDAVGIYGGGGFLLPSRVFTREPGADRFGGQIRDATLRFLTGTPGFEDRISTATVDGSTSARLDPAGARQLAALAEALSRDAGRFAND